MNRKRTLTQPTCPTSDREYQINAVNMGKTKTKD